MDTKQNRIEFTKLLRGYKSGWVAISATFDKVVVWGETLKDVMQKTKDKGQKVFYFPVEKSYSDFIGKSQE